jgi:hypothetical protein
MTIDINRRARELAAQLASTLKLSRFNPLCSARWTSFGSALPHELSWVIESGDIISKCDPQTGERHDADKAFGCSPSSSRNVNCFDLTPQLPGVFSG